MSPLIDALSHWSGRPQVQAALEAHGFLIPAEWQRTVLDHCGPASATEVSRYWDEIAQECVCSAGLANSKKRAFRGETSYRSEYLDNLAAVVDYAEPPFCDPDLLRCLYDFERRSYYDKQFALGVTDALEAKKEREIEELGISVEGWTGKKSDVKPIFQKYIEARGFVCKRQRFAKETQSGLVFQCWVDTGGHSDCVVSLPLYFFIFHKAAPETKFEVSSFNRIVPGFGYYSYFASPSSAVLGLYAHVAMFDLLFRSLENRGACTNFGDRSATL